MIYQSYENKINNESL